MRVSKPEKKAGDNRPEGLFFSYFLEGNIVEKYERKGKECPNFLILKYESLKVLGSPEGGLKSIGNVYLLEDTRDMAFYGVWAEAKLIRNLIV